MPLLTSLEASVYENAQFLYHEDPGLLQNDNQNVSDTVEPLSETAEKSMKDHYLAGETVYQANAPVDLKVVSWAPGLPLERTRSYAYDSAGGAESGIYIIENGIDARNRVCT